MGNVFASFFKQSKELQGGNQRHGKTAYSHNPVDDSLWQINGRHALVVGSYGEFNADDTSIGEKGRIDKGNENNEPFYPCRWKESVKELQVNMRTFSDTGN